MIESSVEGHLAARLRAEREARGWTLADLAARSNVSRAMVSKVERGEASPTAALLGRLSAAFGLTLSQLFARAETGGGQVTRASEQPAWRDPKTGFLRRSLSPAGAAPLELVKGELPSHAEVAYPAAAYTFIADQQVLVLGGALIVVQGGVVHELGIGDCLRFGPPQDTMFRNVGCVPCCYLIAVLRAPGPTGAHHARPTAEPD